MDVASLIIGIVALVFSVLAIPTALQMFYGRPHLTFEADDFTGPDGRILLIAIKNPPVSNRLLRLASVERESADVSGFFDIQEQGTNRILARSVSGLMQTTNLLQIGLQGRSTPGFTVGLTVIATRDGVASIVNGRQQDQSTTIRPGHYVAHIAIVRGQVTYRIDQGFRVGNADHETIWYERKVVSTRK